MNILNKLTKKHLLLNKRRTAVTIVGVVLSCALMLGIGLLFSTYREYGLKEIMNSYGSQHVTIKGVDPAKISLLEKNANIRDFIWTTNLGTSQIENPQNDYRPYIKVIGGSEEFFKKFLLESGRLPQNDNEIVISNQLTYRFSETQEYKLGSEITLSLGTRYLDGEILKNDKLFNQEYDLETHTYQSLEHYEPGENKTYTIVGILGPQFMDNHFYAGYQVYTLDQTKEKELTVYITYMDPKNYDKKTEALVGLLGTEYNNESVAIDYNTTLLSLLGVGGYSNVMNAMTSVIILILIILSVACTIVIYNSFAISVMERKKQFGLFSSVGATKRQLQQTVLFEAFIISLIAIPIGILGSFLGIYVVIEIINHLMADVFGGILHLAVYPLFFYIPLVFIILVILFSAYLPAYKASKITPIEAIRLSDDIKIKNKHKKKKPKKNPFYYRFLSAEMLLSLKSMKRSKGKYRITVISLFISVFLFLSFTTIMKYTVRDMEVYSGNMTMDYSVEYYSKNREIGLDKIKDFRQLSGVEDASLAVSGKYAKIFYTQHKFSSEYMQFRKELRGDTNYSEIKDVEKLPLRELTNYISNQMTPLDTIELITLDNETYRKLTTELQVSENSTILFDAFEAVIYGQDNTRKVYNGTVYDTKTPVSIAFCDNTKDQTEMTKEELLERIKGIGCELSNALTNVVRVKEVPYYLETFSNGLPKLIVSNDTFFSEEMQKYYDMNEAYEGANRFQTFILGEELTSVDTYVNETLKKDAGIYSVYTFDVKKEQQFMRNTLLAVNILCYGFITLVTLIGVTSVLNTITSSIALRKKEFAVLRSIGLSPKGMRKIMWLETAILGFKAFVYALPFWFAVNLYVHQSMNTLTMSGFIVPWDSFAITAIALFLLIWITMRYAMKKIMKENVIDTIRQENI